MDLDWCPCGKRLDGKTPYCSSRCLASERFDDFPRYCESPSSSSCDDFESHQQKRHSSSRRSHRAPSHCRANYDEIKRTFESQHWPGHDHNNIMAWARDIPSGCGSTRPESLTYNEPKLRPTFPLSRQRPVPPALCMSTTQTQSQAHQTRTAATPLATTHGQRRRAPSSAQDGSVSSLATDSIATPMSEDAANGAAAPAVRNRTGVLDGLTSRLRWSQASSTDPKQVSTKSHSRGFTVLSTAHLAEADEADLYFSTKSKPIVDFSACKEARGVMIAKAKDAAYQKMERAPVSLKVERMYAPEEDHPAYRTRGRKVAKAAVGTIGGRV